MSIVSKQHLQLGKSRLLSAAIFVILGVALFVPEVLAVTIINPVTADDFGTMIKNIAAGIRMVAVPFAVVAIIFVGFKLVASSAAGKKEEVVKAKKIIWWVVIGTAIIVGGSYMVQAVIDSVKEISGY